MAIRIDKPWMAFDSDSISRVGGHLGVYQLADDDGHIVYIGVADARTRFGLRGELERQLAHPPLRARRFRYEITTAYRTRHAELLAVFRHDHGRLPVANPSADSRLHGRLRPDGGNLARREQMP